MIERGNGRIMNVASTAAFQPGPLMAVYYATKAYVLSFSEALAEETRGRGVTVTALCPGPTASGFQAGAAMEDSRLVKGRKLPHRGRDRDLRSEGDAARRRGGGTRLREQGAGRVGAVVTTSRHPARRAPDQRREGALLRTGVDPVAERTKSTPGRSQ